MAFCSSVGIGLVPRKPAVSRKHLTKLSVGEVHRVSRRDALQLSALSVAALALGSVPAPANALSMKRILAKAGPPVTMENGIVYRDITVGNGIEPKDGDTVALHYSLYYDGLECESSRESSGLAASPIGFTYGTKSGPGAVLRGINDGIAGMKVGGLRLISVPPALAYGDRGKKPFIPPNATVDFAIQLLSCKRSGTNPNISLGSKTSMF